MANILDIALGEAVTYDPQHFSYEILPNEIYGGSCFPETTIRELISYSDIFNAVEN